MSGTTTEFWVHANGGNKGELWSLNIDAPVGQQLAVGEYLHALRDATGGRAGISISGAGRACNRSTGQFRINEMTDDGGGNVTSIDIDFEFHCEEAVPAMLGEVRVGIAGDGGAVGVGPRSIWWPDRQSDAGSLTLPVTVWNPGDSAVDLGSVSIVGPQAGDFSIALDQCSGVSLLAGGVCQIFVEYQPSVPGSRDASLEVPEVNGGVAHTVAMDAFVWSGRTQLKMDSDSGDWVGMGGTYDFVPDGLRVGAWGDYSMVRLGWVGAGGQYWWATFSAPDGDVLAPGKTFTNAARYPYNGTSPGMDVWGGPPGALHGCNTLTGSFTITDIYVNQFGEVRRFGVKFNQYCDGDSAGLHGTLEYQLNVVDVAASASSIKVTGEVSPNSPGDEIQVQLQRKKQGSGYVNVSKRVTTLDQASRYAAKFKTPSAKSCRVTVSAPTTQGKVSKTFRC